MLEPWNYLTLPPPPVNTFDSSHVDIDGSDMWHICNNITRVLSKQSPLHKEAAILSRFIYKFDKKFRNDIGFRNLKKINTALRKYLQLDLGKDIERFASLLPQNHDENLLPTQQMLQYVLIRIITFSEIMLRILTCSKLGAIFYFDRMKRGESHWMSLMPYALLSRIWSLCKVLLNHSCSWYTCLHKFLDKLQVKGLEFLPSNVTLPTDLENWLDIKNIDNYGRLDWSIKKNNPSSIILEEDELDLDNIIDYVKDINQEKCEEGNNINESNKLNESVEPKPLFANQMVKNVDVGVTISREYFQSFFNKNNIQLKEKVHLADTVTNKSSLDKFIKNEEAYRNEDNDLSLTKHLTFMQWQSLKTNLLTLLDSLSNNRKIERKFKKLWKEKCLDCNQ